MAFKELKRGVWTGRAAATDKVWFSGAGNGKNAANIHVSADILLAMGSPTYIRISLGTGEHSGLILMQPSPTKVTDAYKVSRPSPSCAGKIGITLKRLAVSVSQKISPTTARHELTNDGLVVRIPAFEAKTNGSYRQAFPSLMAAE